MPRRCSCCSSPDRAAIDEALVRRDSFRGIARRFAVSPDAVERHGKAHLPAAIMKAKEAEDVANGDALLRQIQDLQRRTLAILTGAEKDDARTALGAIHQARENVALLSKLLAELRPDTTDPLEALFEKMTSAELDRYACEGTLPDWFPSLGATRSDDSETQR